MNTAALTTEHLQRLRAIVESGTPLARNTVLQLIEHAADKAATITERAQFEALPNNTVIEDCSGDIGIITNGYIWYPETAAISLQRASKRYLPARIIHRGTE